MRSNRYSRTGRSRAILLFIVALSVISGFFLYAAPEERRITVYSNVANYSLSLITRNGQDYVGLLEILEPLGTVYAKGDSSKWKLRYKDIDGEFAAGKSRAKVRGQNFDLPANFLLENGRGMVPVSALVTLLPRFLGGPVTFHQEARRLFVGDVAVHFTAQLVKAAPPSLVLNFSSPVNPSISTEPGKLRMVFTHEPLVPPGTQNLTFDNKTISSASYQENNGAVELSINGSAPLFAKFSNDGRTITVASAPEAGGSSHTAEATPAISAPTSPTPAIAIPQARKYFAVIDASHGGEERGAALGEQLAEKDVTLAFARRLRQELESRGLSVMMVRDTDSSIPLDQRASLANVTHPAIYVCIHAASQGNGVRLYTGMVPNVGDSRGPFLAWDNAQSAFRVASDTAEASIASELQRKQIPVRGLMAPLRPLNNIISAAVAVEVSPRGVDISELTSVAYQQQVATSLAAGILIVRDKLEAAR
jgi:N-acetylmuramoyl-L-alanine amidase